MKKYRRVLIKKYTKQINEKLKTAREAGDSLIYRKFREKESLIYEEFKEHNCDVCPVWDICILYVRAGGVKPCRTRKFNPWEC